MFNFTGFLFQVLLGLLLGDASAWLEVSAPHLNPRFGLKQSVIHIAFLLHTWALFAPFVASKPTATTYYDKRYDKTNYGLNSKPEFYLFFVFFRMHSILMVLK